MCSNIDMAKLEAEMSRFVSTINRAAAEPLARGPSAVFAARFMINSVSAKSRKGADQRSLKGFGAAIPSHRNLTSVDSPRRRQKESKIQEVKHSPRKLPDLSAKPASPQRRQVPSKFGELLTAPLKVIKLNHRRAHSTLSNFIQTVEIDPKWRFNSPKRRLASSSPRETNLPQNSQPQTKLMKHALLISQKPLKEKEKGKFSEETIEAARQLVRREKSIRMRRESSFATSTYQSTRQSTRDECCTPWSADNNDMPSFIDNWF